MPNEQLAERPTLPHDGRRYQRRNGKWLDEGGLAVFDTLSQRLNAKAKQDANFWKLCMDQDWQDDPKHLRDSPFDWVSNEDLLELGIEAEPANDGAGDRVRLAVAGGSSKRRRVVDQIHLDGSLSSKNELKLECDIAGGWRETTNEWCCRTSTAVGLPKGYDVRTVVTIAEDTFGYRHRRLSHTTKIGRDAREGCVNLNSVSPHFPVVNHSDGAIQYTLDGPKYSFLIKLKELSWKTDEKHPREFGFKDYGDHPSRQISLDASA